MTVRRIDEGALYAWVEEVLTRTRVIGIQAKGDRFDFAPLRRASDLRLDYDVSLTPPNRLCFQPPSESLLRFAGVDYRPVLEAEPFVLFGVHPYDMVAINQMDLVFARDTLDVHYMARRQAATVVACDVESVSPNVFAGCMGTASVQEGFDVLLTRVGEHCLVDVRTEKGEALAEPLAGQPEATPRDLEAREQVWRENAGRLRRHELKVKPEELPALLARDEAYNHPVWHERAEKCFGCGSCTNVCPTCYCFDIWDEVDWDLASGRRLRRWDSCQLEGFARVAGGHNFRKELYRRFRHRYYRKGKYVPEMIGQCACVGCGRCISACVSRIAHPPEVFNLLSEEN